MTDESANPTGNHLRLCNRDLEAMQRARRVFTRTALNLPPSTRKLDPPPDVGEAWQNGHAERLIRTIKEEEVDLSDYRDYTDALQQLGRFLNEVYTHKRIHSSLGYLTPAEFEAQWLQQQALAQHVH